MAASLQEIAWTGLKSCEITQVKVKTGSRVSVGSLLVIGKVLNEGANENETATTEIQRLKSQFNGTVEDLFVKPGDTVIQGTKVLQLSTCLHPTVMKDMCADCGADLRVVEGRPGQRRKDVTASVAMIHNIPELHVSREVALEIAQNDMASLLHHRKLVLIVDLDQTIIHTTMRNVPADLPDVHHFQLMGSGPQFPWYHTKIRPGCKKFLESLSKMYQLHIFTMGSRLYAHKVTRIVDPDKKLFADRILSRDECFDPNSKTANLSSIFPNGDNMLVIIDDREDVWNFIPNLIQVKPYQYFIDTDDINMPPGLQPLPKHFLGMNPHVQVVNTAQQKKEEEVNICAEEKNLDKDENGNSKDKRCKMEADSTSESISNDQKVDERLDKDEGFEESVEMPSSSVIDAIENATENRKDTELKSETRLSTGEEGSGNCNQNGIKEKKVKTVDDASLEGNVEKTKEIADDDGPEKTDSEKYEEGECRGDEILTKDTEEQEKNEEIDSQKDKGAKKSDAKDDVKEGVGNEFNDDYFYYLEEVLSRIHSKFYKVYDHWKSKSKKSGKDCPVPDVKCIIPSLRRKVLSGTKVCFTGVFPANLPQAHNKLWKMAQVLGAEVSSKFEVKSKSGSKGGTTHLILGKLGTSKHHAARKSKKVHIVSPDWLVCCWDRWERVDERLFRVKVERMHKISRSDKSTPVTSESESVGGVVSSTDSQANQQKGEGHDGRSEQKEEDEQKIAEESMQASGSNVNPAKRQIRPLSLSEDYNPLYSFSTQDLDNMGKEVSEEMGEDVDSSSESEDDTSAHSPHSLGSITQQISSSSDESLTAESPLGWKKRKWGDRDSESEDGKERERSDESSSSSAGLSNDEWASDEEQKMADAIDDLLTYSKKL